MTGRMLHQADEPHRCWPPHGRDHYDLLPSGPPGSVWRCQCGRLWRVADMKSGDTVMERWQRAGWLLRWRYRRQR